MRLALITSMLNGGGAARALINMANHWAGAGHEVQLFSFEDGAEPPLYALDERVGLSYLDLNKFSPNPLASLRNNWARFKKIRAGLLANAPDAVISFIDTANIRVVLAMLGSRTPVIVSERVHPRHERLGPFWEGLRRLVYPLATALVVQTDDIGSYCAKWCALLRVIPNPVVPAAVLGGAPQLPRPVLLAAGRLYPQKGYDLMLAAFAKIAAKHPEWTLCIAGTGVLQHDIEQKIQDLGLMDRVRLLGQVRDMGGLLAQADAYIMSSAYEGFPNALCEAMAAGVACVSTNCPSGPAEIITDRENGLLTPNGDESALAMALDELLSDATLRQRLGAAAKTVTQSFGPDRIMALWDACLTEAIAASQSRRN